MKTWVNRLRDKLREHGRKLKKISIKILKGKSESRPALTLFWTGFGESSTRSDISEQKKTGGHARKELPWKEFIRATEKVLVRETKYGKYKHQL